MILEAPLAAGRNSLAQWPAVLATPLVRLRGSDRACSQLPSRDQLRRRALTSSRIVTGNQIEVRLSALCGLKSQTLSKIWEVQISKRRTQAPLFIARRTRPDNLVRIPGGAALADGQMTIS